MSLEKVRREVQDTKRELGKDVELANRIAESKKQTMSRLERITSVPDSEDRRALDQARSDVKSDAKSDFSDRVDKTMSDHASKAQETQREGQESQRQVTENANVAKSIASSSDYGKTGVGAFADLMTRRGRDYAMAVDESKRDVQDARQRVDAKRREVES